MCGEAKRIPEKAGEVLGSSAEARNREVVASSNKKQVLRK